MGFICAGHGRGVRHYPRQRAGETARKNKSDAAKLLLDQRLLQQSLGSQTWLGRDVVVKRRSPQEATGVQQAFQHGEPFNLSGVNSPQLACGVGHLLERRSRSAKNNHAGQRPDREFPYRFRRYHSIAAMNAITSINKDSPATGQRRSVLSARSIAPATATAPVRTGPMIATP